MKNDSTWQTKPYKKCYWQPGDLVRIKTSVLQEESTDAIGIVIKNSGVQLAFEQGFCDEWDVLLNGKVKTVSAQSIWPMSPEDDYLKYVNTDLISY